MYLLCTSFSKTRNVVKLAFTVARHLNALTSTSQIKYPASIIEGLPARYSTSTIFHNFSPAEMEVSGVPLSQVVQVLEAFAPTSLAEKWDNVGLLVAPEEGSEKLISNILLTNDLSEDVLKEAVTGKFDMIISYHPPIFEAVKRITSSTWKGRILQTCLRRDIALYSPHTSWDAVRGGVNDWIIQAFDAFNPTSKPILESVDPNKLGSHIPGQTESNIIRFKFPGHVGDITLQKVGDYVRLDVIKLTEDTPQTFGMGRFSTLGSPQKLKEIVELVKKHLEIPDVSLALARGTSMDKLITTVAVCAGSGGSVLKGQKADLFITGEMSHHEVLDAVHQGVSVILTRHSNSERGFLKRFVSVYFNKHLEGKVNVVVSSEDKDPLHTA